MTDRPLADYAMLSDSNSAALVSVDGWVDWLCLPRFDSPSLFGRLLDERAGTWGVYRGDVDLATHPPSRRYRDDSMVLETTYADEDGELVVVDAMPFLDTPEPHDLGTGAPHALVRHARCTRGSVTLAVHYEPRPEYGLMVPILKGFDGGVFHLEGSSRVTMSSTVPVDVDSAVAEGRVRLEEGDEAWLSVRRVGGVDADPDPWSADDMRGWLEDTEQEWRSWVDVHEGPDRYDGPWRDLVNLSGRVLQSLTYRHTGAIVAAPTTSLPEVVGGTMNWDYRYCWVRDTAMTLEALRVSACPREVNQFLDWIVRTAGGDLQAGQALQVMYGIGGEHELGERPLPHLDGWRGSQPVRVGNGAWNQRQLDVYGELIEALATVEDSLRELDHIERRFIVDLADSAGERWREPDQGIWELRGDPAHHVHSKLMCWVALERAVALADRLDASDRVDGWRAEAEEIRTAIIEQGWNPQVGAFTQTFGSQRLDAAVLTLAITGFLPADDDRLLSTYDAIEEGLGTEDGLIRRYAGSGGSSDEGVFLLCTFWLAQARALAGQVDRATAIFERAIGCANDVGLLAEEVDPDTGELIGNFPQAFSHIGLVNAAAAIDRARRDAAGA